MDYQFSSDDLIFSLSHSICESSEFDVLLKGKWQEAVDRGLCKYKLNGLQTRILDGGYSLVAQLNPERAYQRRRPQDLQRVSAPFDDDQFNFCKVLPAEILLSPKHVGCVADNALIINVSPLEFGNCLLVPNLSQRVPQRATFEGIHLLIEMMLLSRDRPVRTMLITSRTAIVSDLLDVAETQFHLNIAGREATEIVIANCMSSKKVEHIAGPCFALKDFPSKGFAFQLEDNDVTLLAQNVHRLVTYLSDAEIAHNLFFTRGERFDCVDACKPTDTLRVFVWARKSSFGVKQETAFNPAMCELAGHLLIKDAYTFETISQVDVCGMLDELTAPLFSQLLPRICHLYSKQSQ